MADVAQILGVGLNKSTTGGDDSAKVQDESKNHFASATAASFQHQQQNRAMPPPPAPASHQPSRAMKMLGLPREVMQLLSGKRPQQQQQQQSDDSHLTAELPMSVPMGGFTSIIGERGKTVQVGNKRISISKPARKWVWAPFSSSSRTDGLLLHHWVRANVEYPDYPYARFDIHLDPVTYTDDEYRLYLQSDDWTKSETDVLLDLARTYELRWSVIYDRWIEIFCQVDIDVSSVQHQRKIEDIQHRYYSVAAKVTQSRISQEAAIEAQKLAATVLPDPTDPETRQAADQLIMDTAAARALASADGQQQPLIHVPGIGSSNKVFDLEYERERRAHMEALWKRTKEEEAEEAEIRKELKQVEAQLRKVKKGGAHILAAAGASSGGGNGIGGGTASLLPSAASSANPSRSVSPMPPPSAVSLMATVIAPDATVALTTPVLDHAFASTAPVPTRHTPYLQSGRLAAPAYGGSTGLNKSLLTRMDTVLREMKVPIRPLPTKRVCDLYDALRKDVVTLLILQKSVLQREGQLQSKRLRLAKLGGNVRLVDEETLLGIAPPVSVPPPAVAAASGLSSSGGGSSTSSTRKPKGPKATKSKPAVSGGVAKSKGGAISPVAMTAKSKVGVEGSIPGASTSGFATTTSAGVSKSDAKETSSKPTKSTVVKRKRKAESVSRKSPASVAATAPMAVAPITASEKIATTMTQSSSFVTTTETTEIKSSGKKRVRKNG